MTGLRRQFGLILGVALIPLLIVSIWQAVFNYNIDRDRQLSLMRETARTSVSEVIGAFNTTQSIITVAGRQMTPDSCKQVISRIMETVPIIYNIALATSNGDPYCEGIPIRTTAFFSQAKDYVSPIDPYYMNIAELPPSSYSKTDRLIVITHGVYDDEGVLLRLVFAGFDETVISALKNKGDLDSELSLGIYDASGNHLLGNKVGVETETLKTWLKRARLNGEYQPTINDSDGKPRDILALSTDAFDTFIIATLPERKLLDPEVLTSLTSLFIPITAWFLTLGAIWWASHQLVLRPVDSMRRQLKFFKNSAIHPHLKFRRPPPRELFELANAFNDLSNVVQQQEQELKASLSEKETLLREIHHRVKNNLQIIISLLNMQERKVSDRAGLAAIVESRNRVNAISLVHKALYESDTLKYIDMGFFLKQLTQQLKRALLLDKKKINLILNVDCSPMDSEQAMPVSLFVVEALTNSVKHTSQPHTKIEISLREDKDHVTVSVIDNGGGQPDEGCESAAGMGSRLMAGFARQLGGRYEGGSTSDGYSARLNFKKSS